MNDDERRQMLDQTEIDLEVHALQIREAAQDQMRRIRAGAVALPPLVRLDEFLAVPDEDVTYRIEGLMPTGANIVLAAQYKAGKSVAVGNLTRSLADGTPFLGGFETSRAESIVLIDNEFDERMLRRWMRDYGIQSEARVRLIALRGRTALFDIMNPAVRAQWAEHIGPTDVLIFDCLRPVLDALGLSEDKDAGRFLVALDALKTDAGISESVVVHHMGHSGERSRGDSRILDWPDATWNIVRESDDPSSARYFRALGRDVEVREGRLEYERPTRTLIYADGSRREARADASTVRAIDAVVEFVAQNPGCSGEDIRRIEGYGRSILADARARALSTGLIVQSSRGGRGGGFAYFSATPPNPAGSPPGDV